jgi:hypothetical protein
MVLDAGARDGLHYPGEADQFVVIKRYRLDHMLAVVRLPVL